MTSPLERAGLRPRVDKALAAFLAIQRSRLLAIDEALAEIADALDDFVLGGAGIAGKLGYLSIAAPNAFWLLALAFGLLVLSTLLKSL